MMNNKLRIAIFSDTSLNEVNGVATSVRYLMKVLENNGHEVYLFTSGENNNFDEENHIITIKGKQLKKLYNYYGVFPLHSNVKKIFKELNFDLVHVNTEFGVGILGYQCAKKFKKPLVYTYHTKLENYIYYIFKNLPKKELIKILKKLTKKYVNDSSEVIVPGKDTKAYLESCGVKKNINIVPTGIDIDRFSLEEKDYIYYRTKIRNFLKISNDCKVILCLGRLASEKNFDETIEKFANYKEANPKANTKLVFVGDGPFLENLKEQASALNEKDNILFVGKVAQDDIHKYYTIGDVFLNCSLSETQGLTYMEAMASKLIILTKKASYLEGVIKDNKTGFCFETQDEFNDKLNKIFLLNNEEKKKILSNEIDVVRDYSLELFYDNIMVVYHKALEKGL